MNLIMLVIRTGVVGTCNKLCNNMAEREAEAGCSKNSGKAV